jgi:hypothetical protein
VVATAKHSMARSKMPAMRLLELAGFWQLCVCLAVRVESCWELSKHSV